MLLKKSKKIVLIVIAIVAILVSFIGGRAYAKYMSKVTGNGTADVASWSFKVNENAEKMQTISLKSTINNSTLVNNKIAPGTAGTFQIKVDATGADVGINYNVKFENESKKPTNLKFEYDGKTFNSLTELQDQIIGTINSNDNEKIKTISIHICSFNLFIILFSSPIPSFVVLILIIAFQSPACFFVQNFATVTPQIMRRLLPS